VKADLLERVFRAIATDDEVAVDKLLDTIVREERKKGHIILADRLENITKSKTKSRTNQTDRRSTPPTSKPAPAASATNLQALTELPNSKRSQLPLLTAIPREQLRHHTILPAAVEQRFQRIEREYAARDRLAHHGFNYKQKSSCMDYQAVAKL
jgi:hypothetical protein